jgi:hypothetical protein
MMAKSFLLVRLLANLLLALQGPSILMVRLTSFPIILMVGGTVEAADGAIVPPAADIDEDVVISAPEGPVDNEPAALSPPALPPAPPVDCSGCISDSSRTESLSKLILNCDQRCVG